jgi:hypothetical protein
VQLSEELQSALITAEQVARARTAR